MCHLTQKDRSSSAYEWQVRRAQTGMLISSCTPPCSETATLLHRPRQHARVSTKLVRNAYVPMSACSLLVVCGLAPSSIYVIPKDPLRVAPGPVESLGGMTSNKCFLRLSQTPPGQPQPSPARPGRLQTHKSRCDRFPSAHFAFLGTGSAHTGSPVAGEKVTPPPPSFRCPQGTAPAPGAFYVAYGHHSRR